MNTKRSFNPAAQCIASTIACTLASTLLGACASTPARTESNQASQSQPADMRTLARSVNIRRGDGSGITPWKDVVAEMASADVVLFGEMHGHPLGLAVAQELFEDILTQRPQTVLAMEFYERDQQLIVNDYLSGITDRPAFDKAANKTPQSNPPAHIRMIDAAKEAGRPVIAANAPRRYVRKARTDGYESLQSLSPLQRSMFEIPIGSLEGAYKDRFMALMSGMGGHSGEEIAQSFFRSQAVWDATMGDSIVDALELGTPVAQVVGYFHIQFGNEPGGSGLIDAIRKRSDRDLKIVSIIQLARDDQPLFMGTEDQLDDEGNIVEDGEDADLDIATYVVYVGAGED